MVRKVGIAIKDKGMFYILRGDGRFKKQLSESVCVDKDCLMIVKAKSKFGKIINEEVNKRFK